MKGFFERLNSSGKPKRVDLVEKDFRIHRLLDQISRDEYFRDNLAFKGGTCLIKAYLGYHRFSEDIDFTWIDDGLWKEKSVNQIKNRCSEEIAETIRRIKVISDRLGLGFGGDKKDPNEVHISSGGRMAAFHLGYLSDTLNVPSRIKVEINFVDILLFPIVKRKLMSYADTMDSDEIRFLYEGPWKDYTSDIVLTCYDPQEIFVEKCRASLTRGIHKHRDAVDIWFMEKRYGFSIPKYRSHILEKIRFMSDLYRRYRENVEWTRFHPSDIDSSEEAKLMLAEIPSGMQRDIARIHQELDNIRNEVVKER